MFLRVFIFIVAIHLSLSSSPLCLVDDSLKKDCGYYGIDEDSCISSGCCWSPAGENSVTPWCYSQASTAQGYQIISFKETDTGFTGSLSLIQSSTTTSSPYGASIENLSLDIYFETSDTIRVKITDAINSRWEIPETLIPRFHTTAKPSSINYKFTYTESPFSFEIIRTSDLKSLFKLDSNSFVFSDQYIEFSTTIDSSATTFGLGESTRLSQALIANSRYTLWAADIPAISMYTNLYGSYPYYLQMINGSANGAMLMNSNGMDVYLQNDYLTFKVIGGIIDLYVFAGSSPSDVISQYTKIIGTPAMMPYWSLGFHNCKYGYTSLNQVKQVVANYTAANIPLDTQWMDIDYMQNYRDFTFDSVNFPVDEVKLFVDQLHTDGKHFVPIVDPGIMVYKGYDAYEKGIQDEIFIKDLQGNYYLGQVWPGPTYFPDFFNPNTQGYWTTQIKNFHEQVNIDGIWIDMNEISNFCNNDGKGQVCVNSASNGCPAPGASQTDCCLQCKTVDNNNKYDFPPYAIHNLYGLVSTKTIAMSSTQYNNISVYNSHNLYGLSEQIATTTSLETIREKRPFVLTRSSFISTGVHTAKWTGDNGATWNDLKSSIISVVDFNMFAVPMIGADICGFLFDTTEELCARWIEVGAFYPFARNHNALGQTPQELYVWDSVAEAARNALGMRYQLLPYLYTLFYYAHINGDTVARSLWLNFPSDVNCLSINGQFMWGDAILISPVVDQGSTSVKAYFPQGYWYNFAGKYLEVDASSGGMYKELSTPLTSVNVHVRGGRVIPLQNSALTTTAARLTPFTLFTVLCPGKKAFGSLFWDDGEEIDNNNYISISYEADASNESKGKFFSTTNYNNYSDSDSFIVGNILIIGIDNAPSKSFLNGLLLKSTQVTYDSEKKSLLFSELGLKLSKTIDLKWN